MGGIIIMSFILDFPCEHSDKILFSVPTLKQQGALPSTTLIHTNIIFTARRWLRSVAVDSCRPSTAVDPFFIMVMEKRWGQADRRPPTPPPIAGLLEPRLPKN